VKALYQFAHHPRAGSVVHVSRFDGHKNGQTREHPHHDTHKVWPLVTLL
jgi:hypothetical protein